MSDPHALTVDQLAAALRSAARGVYPDEAASELLIHHELWLHRRDFRRHIEVSGSSAMAWVRWKAAIEALRQGELPCSSSEGRVLTVAASFAAHVPVDLRDAVSGLDNVNIGYLAAAVLRANGRHDEMTVDRLSASPDRAGAARAIQLRQALHALEEWPPPAGT